jgi:hypothetical protein
VRSCDAKEGIIPNFYQKIDHLRAQTSISRVAFYSSLAKFVLKGEWCVLHESIQTEKKNTHQLQQ